MEREAAILAVSLVQIADVAPASIVVAYPIQSASWRYPVVPADETLGFFRGLGVETLPFENADFGSRYPHANRVYAMLELGNHPALFVDSDMIALGPVPSFDPGVCLTPHFSGSPWGFASAAPENLASWSIVYSAFGLTEPNIEFCRNGKTTTVTCAYFNAGAVGVESAADFGRAWLETMVTLDRQRGRFTPEVTERFLPYLDQISLPVTLARTERTASTLPRAINSFRPNNNVALWHYHILPMLFRYSSITTVSRALNHVFGDDRLAKLLRTDETLQYWRGSKGAGVIREVDNLMEQKRSSDERVYRRLLRELGIEALR